MEDNVLILDNGKPLFIKQVERKSKTLYKISGTLSDNTPAWALVSFPVWTIRGKHITLQRLLETHYKILELHISQECGKEAHD